MQEYVEERTVAISVKAGKLSGRALAAACKKVLAEMKKHHEAAKRPHGRQSVKKLMNHYGTKSAMTLVGAPRDFDRIAKEFHVDYAFHKTSPGHYLLFFKADQADAITAAFSKYTEKVMGRSQERPSSFKWVIDKEPTATRKGSKHEECTVCGYKKAAVVIPAKGSTVKPSDQPDKPGNTASANTGDSSDPVLWSALLFISGGAVIGTTVVSRKKKYNR